MVQVKSYSIITDEIGKFRRPNLFSIPVENSQDLDFCAAICRKTNFFGTLWTFFLISMVIQLSLSKFSERLIKN